MAYPAQAYDAGDSAVALHPLTFVEEGDQVIIGRPDIDSFAVFPADAAAVVRRLRNGEDPGSVAAWYQQAYGEPADIEDFIDTLRDLGFVRSGEAAPSETPARLPVRWQRTSVRLFSAPALALYALAAAAAGYLMVTVPALRPTPSAVFFSKSLLIVVITTTAVQLAGIFWHEAFHVLAGRRLGLPSKLSVGRRLNFVVVQTTMTGLMGVPSRKRILPFLAGLIADAIAISFLIGLADVGRLAGWPTVIGGVAVAMAYATILRMLWQALIFMETDLYHVLVSAVRCPDLHRMTRTYLLNRLSGLRGRPVQGASEAGWTARDLTAVRWYAPFMVAGGITALGLVVATTIPVLTGLALRIYHGLVTGTFASRGFWDAAITGAVILAQFAFLGAVIIRDGRRRRLTAASA